MKTTKNIYDKIVSKENLVIASQKAVAGKRHGLIKGFLRNSDKLLDELHKSLLEGSYKPSKYREMYIHEPKKRLIKIAPFFPDRIVHHAIMNVVEPILSNVLIHHTYACIKGKGGHRCIADLYADMKSNYFDTTYCLKFDIRKFYDNVDHAILKSIIRRKISDAKALDLIDSIIDSADTGIPIGNYTSQHFSNLYLAYFDHYCKEELKLKYYYRYMDDIVILAASKTELHKVFIAIENYLKVNLKLEIKANWQIFPVDKRQIDFCGYRVNHHGIMLRKKILYNFFRKSHKLKKRHHFINEDAIKHAMPSHYGWLKHTSTHHFNKVIQNTIN